MKVLEINMKGTWITVFSVMLAAIVIGGLLKISLELVTNVWFWIGMGVILIVHIIRE